MPRHKQLLLGLLGLLPCLACVSPSEGDRTTSGTCPAGETCSTTTPGLFFVGTVDVGDSGPRRVGVVAIGGTERVELRAGSSVETATTFTASIDVVSDTPAVLAVVSSSGGVVVVRGVSEGSATLRVLEHGTTTLVDQVAVTVLDGREVEIRPIALDDASADVLAAHSSRPFAMYAGAHVELAAAFGSVDFVVDTSLVITDAAGTQVVTGEDGAPYRFTVDASSAHPATFHVHAAGRDSQVDVPIVTQLDDIRFRETLVDSTHRLCAVPQAAGRDVVGAPDPAFTALGGASLGAQHGACVDFVPATTRGAGTITATIAGVTAGTAV
jgi:hypothetical protein